MIGLGSDKHKKRIFSKPFHGRILISWNLIVDTFFCTKIKKFTIVNFFSLDACSGPMCLISQYLSLPITIFTLSYLTGRVLWLGSTAQFWVYPPLQLPSPAGWLPQFSPWQWSVLATRWCGVYSQDERQVIFNSSNLPVSATALFIMTFFLLLYFQGLYCGGRSGFNNFQTACNAPDFIPKRGSPDCQWPDWFGKILENTTKCSNFNSFQ